MPTTVTRENIALYVADIERAAQAALEAVRDRLAAGGLNLLFEIKFMPIGREPLAPSAPLNLVEQVNQTFTCLVSFRAAQRLFELHPGLSGLLMNIGNANGPDITGTYPDGDGVRHVSCEVFAAVAPDNNRKLSKDVNRVAGTAANDRYVFFYSPGYEPGLLRVRKGVQIHVVDLNLPSGVRP